MATPDVLGAAETSKPSSRLDFLDALRGVAAAYVVLFHLEKVGGVAAPQWLEGLVARGGGGVMLFFVVSCFSLFFTMPARLRERRPMLSFYTHRFFRIAPLFYFWLLTQCLLIVYKYEQPARDPWEIVESILFIFNFVPGNQPGIVMGSWTIGVEMLFYLVFPFVYFRTKNLRDACSLVLLTMILYFGMKWLLPLLPIPANVTASYVFWFFVKDLPVFAFGAVCYFLLQEKLTKGRVAGDKSTGTLLLASATYLLIAYSYQWLTDQFFGEHPYIWEGVVYSLLLLGLFFNPLRALVNRVTTFLGTVSYSLYLAHAPLILLLRPWYAQIKEHDWYPTVTFLLCVSLTFAVALPLSYLTYRLIELPFIGFGKRAYKWLETRLPTTPEPNSLHPEFRNK